MLYVKYVVYEEMLKRESILFFFSCHEPVYELKRVPQLHACASVLTTHSDTYMTGKLITGSFIKPADTDLRAVFGRRAHIRCGG